MPQPNVICLVVDRLHAGMIGAYGNRWVRTPAIDTLACESFLGDQASVTTPELPALYRACWQGEKATLPGLLRQAGWHTALMTDDVVVARQPLAGEFAELIEIPRATTDRSAVEIEDTHLAAAFAQLEAWLASARQPFFLWAHLQFAAGAWDAPLDLRNQYAEEDDPDPPTFVTPPDYWLAENADPDEVLGVRHAYAGQVALLDDCLGRFHESFAASPLAATTQLTLLSARGFPLGEHRRIGPCDQALYNETTQLVWLMRFPDERGKLFRSQALVEPADLPGTLLDWLAIDRAQFAGRASSLLPAIDGTTDRLRDRLILRSQHDRAIRTPAWLLRQPESGPVELYAKPGDRWEVNEVSRLLGDIAGQLETALESDADVPLAEPLVREVD